MKHLFTFTRPHHIALVLCAFFTAAVVAAGRTAYAILLGKIFDVISRWGAGALTGEGFLSEISKWCVYMCLLGLGLWLSASVDIALWVTAGELRAKTARNALFASLLRKTTQWYDLKENGMSSLMVQIQT